MPKRIDNRKGDRHKPRTGDRHSAAFRAKEKAERKPWAGKFVAFDGEGWDGKYVVLACSALPFDLTDEENGLSTGACLKYLTDRRISSIDAMIGYGLSYDFEMILRDLPEEDFFKLKDREEVIFFDGDPENKYTTQYTLLNYQPKKQLEIHRHYIKRYKLDGDWIAEPATKKVFLQDIIGFFQSSFEAALEKWKIETPEIIKIGKALRGDFNKQPLEFIKAYNREELRLMVELMGKLQIADREAFETIGLEANHKSRIWYGPGSRANNFLSQTNWVKEHPEFTGDVAEKLKTEVCEYFPLIPKINFREGAELEKNIYEVDQEIKKITKSFEEPLREAVNSYDGVIKKIKAKGKISASRQGAWFEEYKGLAPHLKNKNGRPLDEVSDELGLEVRELLDILTLPKGQALELQALRQAETTEEYWALKGTKDALEKALEDLVPTVNPQELLEYQNLKVHPFAAAYFGGRIEAAGLGTFACKLYDYDINSAYPYAISNLPTWEPEDLIEVTGWDPLDRMGMYHIKWDLPQGVNFYPFPFRSEKKNVFFPRTGEGWVMSPEVDAALEIYGRGIQVINGYMLKGTEGAGNGVTRLPGSQLCTTAKKIAEMADARLIAKAAKESKEKAIKLVMNSTYGKTIQHIGTHKFLNGFAAAWITSTCRAIISRAIGADVDESIVAIMTDGILTRKELNVNLGKKLGEFERDDFIFAIQLMPGIYLLEREDGTTVKRFRGMSKNFDARDAVKVLHKELINRKAVGNTPARKSGYYEITVTPFVTRTLAVRQPNVFGDKMYLFSPHVRQESFSLGAKRGKGPKGYRLLKGEENRFFPPKENQPGHPCPLSSRPYFLDLEDLMLDYDDAETLEEMLDDRHLGSILKEAEYELY